MSTVRTLVLVFVRKSAGRRLLLRGNLHLWRDVPV